MIGTLIGEGADADVVKKPLPIILARYALTAELWAVNRGFAMTRRDFTTVSQFFGLLAVVLGVGLITPGRSRWRF